MLDSEKLNIAARMHVLLRRQTGRVTDTEWMASNAEYAAEIVKFARLRAVKDERPDLADMAGKLESAMQLSTPSRSTAQHTVSSASFVATGIERYIYGIR